MGEERRRILQMLAEGRITPEQADELLEVLEPELAASAGPTKGEPFRRASRRNSQGATRASSNPVLHKLAEARMMGITPEYVREMSTLGFGQSALEELVQMRIHGVTPEFVREMRDLGLEGSAGELIKLRMGGIDANFVLQMQDLGFFDMSAQEPGDLSVEDIGEVFEPRTEHAGRHDEAER